LLLAGLLPADASDREPQSIEVAELELALETRDGRMLLARFLVDSPDGDHAVDAAVGAIEALYPGATILGEPGTDDAALEAGDGVVRSQWNAWGWDWSEDEIPVSVAYNPVGASGGFTGANVLAALEAWSSVPGSAFAFSYAGETDLLASMNNGGEDGSNVIAWQDLGCDSGCVLGLTTKSFVTHELDISLNSNPGARLGNAADGFYDVASVLVHELGHMAGLEHSCPALGPCTPEEAEAVMYWSYRGVHRELEADDIAGLVALYPGESVTSTAAGPVPGPGVVVPGASPQPAGIVALAPGWNLTQLPAGPFDGYSASLSCVRAIYAYDPIDRYGWSHWVRGLQPALQTLGAAEPGIAYWVLSDGSCAASFQ